MYQAQKTIYVPIMRISKIITGKKLVCETEQTNNTSRWHIERKLTHTHKQPNINIPSTFMVKIMPSLWLCYFKDINCVHNCTSRPKYIVADIDSASLSKAHPFCPKTETCGSLILKACSFKRSYFYLKTETCDCLCWQHIPAKAFICTLRLQQVPSKCSYSHSEAETQCNHRCWQCISSKDHEHSYLELSHLLLPASVQMKPTEERKTHDLFSKA